MEGDEAGAGEKGLGGKDVVEGIGVAYSGESCGAQSICSEVS